MATAVYPAWLLIAAGVLVGLALVVGALVLWLTGRNDPPRRED
jgi:hypothetical protein